MKIANGAVQSNGFKIVFEELKRRTREPRGQVVYWAYFIGSVCIIGGIGIILEIYKYFYLKSITDPNSIYFAMATFFPALIGSSAMQIMFEPASDRRMMAVSIFSLIGTAILAAMLISASGTIPTASWLLVVGACLFALWVWWISNADNLGLYDEPPPPIDAAVGGDDPSADLRGNTNGFQV